MDDGIRWIRQRISLTQSNGAPLTRLKAIALIIAWFQVLVSCISILIAIIGMINGVRLLPFLFGSDAMHRRHFNLSTKLAVSHLFSRSLIVGACCRLAMVRLLITGIKKNIPNYSQWWWLLSVLRKIFALKVYYIVGISRSPSTSNVILQIIRGMSKSTLVVEVIGCLFHTVCLHAVKDHLWSWR